MEAPLFKIVNAALREHNSAILAKYADYIHYTNDALKQLPKWKGITYRGIDCKVSSSLYETGNIVTWQAFSSSTTNAKVARDFLSSTASTTPNSAPNGTLFILDSLSAVSVKDLSSIPTQDEVLYGVNSQFRVKGTVSEGTMQLLSQAMDVRLSDVYVYELQETNLTTCAGVIDALTIPEQLALPKVINILKKHLDEPMSVLKSVEYEELPDEEKHLEWYDTQLKDDSEDENENVDEDKSRGNPKSVLDLVMEVSEHYPDVVRVMLAAGADSTQGAPIATLVRYSGHCTKPLLRVYNDLKKSGANVAAVDAAEQTALNWAAGDDDCLEWVKVLLKEPEVDVNFQGGTDRKTPLMVAAMKGYTEICQLLLDAGASLTLTDAEGNSALMLAIMYKHEETVDLLISDETVNIVNENGMTGLMFAGQVGSVEIVSQLLDYHADVHVEDYNERTAVAWAAERGHWGVVDLLVANGAEKVFAPHSLALVVWQPPTLVKGVYKRQEREERRRLQKAKRELQRQFNSKAMQWGVD
eukprot:TRINITY_DN103767_c0_g1_i1.p1 TRINITY_DN103767_c0_g1~~TRINITY_DN103767_c0_g1_i1.p1  ORF type:complete len:583 (-),score=42.81 TRINITY_DN103767_c0_g1_i1:400-1980(-)